ncbi:uncharacterized protein L3040_002910 [Drepanopeziza brunnea f. sp. 'multigermtubi']|uniref:uncharacterized protein n=1 Tax=Drepanopeziza brunnea f. sp. 'multigermtubi' TaxID=698441 RepID=UPI002383D114|nr:hypothetical protein L3040_002910 [Drepanopeziza brunnea f. sp. 'multigermtubi']
MSDPPTSTASTSLLPIDALFNNPLFAGGVGLAGLTAAAAVARKGVIRGAGLVRRRLLSRVEISKNDPSYKWVLAWLSLPRPQTGFISSRITRLNDFSMATTTRGDKANDASFFLQPGYGKYIIRHENAYIGVNREKQASSNMHTGEPHEIVTLTALYAQRHIFESLFREAHHLALSAQEGKTVMYTAQIADWKPFGEARKKRPLHSVVLDEGIKERIVDDVKDFLTRQSWYVERGIPYRRGYLLYGPPGSGKSSFIQGLAGELDFGIALINLSQRGMTDDRLSQMMTVLPPRTILLLEDADAAFSNRQQATEDGYSGMTVTFSGLLNALDGVAAGEERVTFLTTNHIDRLDEALIRPGRVDMTVRIGEATRYQAGEMWERFYGDVDEGGKGKLRFLQRLEELGLVTDAGGQTKPRFQTSTAAIQGLFLFNKDSMDGAIGMAEGLIPRIYESEQHVAGIKVPA